MKQIKLIKETTSEDFEKKVNNYLKSGKRVTKITYRTESIVGGFLFMAIIEYETGLRR